MTVYHGTTLTIKRPKILRSEIGRDFGFAFYTTDIKEQAYDIVCGKIANDNVGETVSYVVQGIMRKEDALKRLKFERINNQIAFCTEKSLQYLRFIESYEVMEGGE
ncbi:MAG: DUF3990 domain-containing protein [Roseburia sp.]|nr:DUF3990 domain-containing protein [Roseburia sp.]